MLKLSPRTCCNRLYRKLCAGSQAPAWEPFLCKLQLAPTPEAGASKTAFPSRSLGTSNKNGFTLIELMVVLTILAITATILIKSSAGLQDQSRYDQTVDRVNKIKQAIVNVTTVNGVPQVSGFVADMGRLPNNVRELLLFQPCSDGVSLTQAACIANSGTWITLWVSGICSDPNVFPANQPTCLAIPPNIWLPVGYGWRTPYVQTTNNPSNSYAFTDGWGNNYAFPSMAASIICAQPYSLITFPNNQSNCAELDTSSGNYGWRFDHYDPPDQTITTNYLLNLQSYGSDGLPDTINNTASEPYQTDYPANANQPVIHLQDWLFNIGTAATVLNLPSIQQLQPTSVTINLSHTSPSSLTFTARDSADVQTVCNMVGGTWTTPNCIINSTLCGVLGGTWNGTSATIGACTLNQQPLQSLCTSRSAGGTWSIATGQCILKTLSQANCSTGTPNLGGNYINGECTILAPPALATTCNKFSGGGTPCQIDSGKTIFSNATGVSGISDFCSAMGGYWNTAIPASPYCFIAAPLLPFTPSTCISNSPAQCTQNICLNIFHRNLTASTPIVVATASATVTNDGQPHVLGFQGFSVYDLNGNALIDNLAAPPKPVLIPVGQNAISVTQANSDSTCKATPVANPPALIPWANPPYPANHPAGAIPQTFLPGMPLIFNW